jgi:bifunctional UDP-N-acetylglucosamine pyrophosphorylase/glucosamine-1-phosphate N-acetyltransferase
MRELAVVILAAGQGKRMKSNLPKVLHPLGGRPMVQHVLDTASALNPSRLIVVVGNQAEQVQSVLNHDAISFVKQTQRMGTGHAVMQAEAALDASYDVLVLYGDMPLLRSATLQALMDRYRAGNSPLAMLIVANDESRGFGRVIIDPAGRVSAVVEEAECTPEQLAIRELNAGVYCFESRWLWTRLPQLPLHAGKGAAGEYFLTDLVGIAAAEGFEIPYLITLDSAETLGINTTEHLAEAEAILHERRKS